MCGPCIGGYHGEVSWVGPDENGVITYHCHTCDDKWDHVDRDHRGRTPVEQVKSFVESRLVEDSVVADAAGAQGDNHGLNRGWGEWWVSKADDPDERSKLKGCRIHMVTTDGANKTYSGLPTMLHFARHDPAHVVREISVKQKILDLWSEDGTDETSRIFPLVLEMAKVWSNHEDYREEWESL